jgi:hypothetical protein
MIGRAERLRRQQQMEKDWAADQAERPNEPVRPVPVAAQCPANLGGAHDFTMGGRCWYCCQPKPEKT